MTDYTHTTFGDAWAVLDDDQLLGWPDPRHGVHFLKQRATDGRALELGIGTGTMAIPLAEAGVEVIGIEPSQLMLDRLEAKARKSQVEERIHAVIGELHTFHVNRKFSLIYCLRHRFMQLQTQEEQKRFLRNVTSHLAPNGCFVLESLIPNLSRFRGGQDFITGRIEPDRVLFTASLHDELNQHIKSMMIEITQQGIRLFPDFSRYYSPYELILMAEQAGLQLSGRWGNWHGAPFSGKIGAYLTEFHLFGAENKV